MRSEGDKAIVSDLVRRFTSDFVLCSPAVVRRNKRVEDKVNGTADPLIKSDNSRKKLRFVIYRILQACLIGNGCSSSFYRRTEFNDRPTRKTDPSEFLNCGYS